MLFVYFLAELSMKQKSNDKKGVRMLNFIDLLRIKIVYLIV